MQLPNNAQPRITRLSKVLSGLLVIVFAVDYYLPDTAGYLALIPGRCAARSISKAWTSTIPFAERSPAFGI